MDIFIYYEPAHVAGTLAPLASSFFSLFPT
jgi:hypothetical protein